MLDLNSNRWHLEIYFSIFPENRVCISCNGSPLNTSNPFFRENIILSAAGFAQIALKVNYTGWTKLADNKFNMFSFPIFLGFNNLIFFSVKNKAIEGE